VVPVQFCQLVAWRGDTHPGDTHPGAAAPHPPLVWDLPDDAFSLAPTASIQMSRSSVHHLCGFLHGYPHFTAQPCLLHDISTFGTVMGTDLLSGT
jgi:hypothetical protein